MSRLKGGLALVKHQCMKPVTLCRSVHETTLWPYKSIAQAEVYRRSVLEWSRQLPEWLEQGKIDVVAPEPVRFFPHNVRRHFQAYIDWNHLQRLMEVTRRIRPSFSDALHRTLEGHVLYYGNISVMRNELFEEYCQLMFDLVDAHVEDVVRSGYLQNVYQEKAYARVAGYLGEVITSAFVEECKRRFHVEFAPVAMLNG